MLDLLPRCICACSHVSEGPSGGVLRLLPPSLTLHRALFEFRLRRVHAIKNLVL